jgi:phytoene desaturase
MNKQILVIGGGVGGLSAAIRLAARGQRVTVLEKNPRVGGKLNLWEVPHPDRPDDPPFRFDTGPSLLTLPFIFQDLFAAAGEDVRDHLELHRLDPIARFIWRDGTTFELKADEQDLRQELSRISPVDVAGWTRILRRGRVIWDLSAESFLFKAPEQSIRSGGRFSLSSAIKLLSVPLRIGMFGNYAKYVDRQITSQKLREVLYQYATYSGASPFKAPATLAVIPFVEHYFGGFHIKGGMYRLAEQLEAVARKLGVTIRPGTAVSRILIEPAGRNTGQVRGVQLSSGEQIPSSMVIANSDVVFTYRHLIDARFRPTYPNPVLDQFEPGASGLILMLGIDGAYPQLAHHTKFMPGDYSADLRAMFDTKTVPNEPCIYVCAPGRSDPSLAPPGCEALFVLASAPPLDGSINWQVEARRYRDHLVRTLETRCGLTDLSKRIVVERIMSPEDLKNLYNANAGSIYGIGSNGRRQAFLRPPNRDRHIRGLYFAGGATHPGGGLPLVALSGKIVSELVMEDTGP